MHDELGYRAYRVSRRQKEPLLRFLTDALVKCGCSIIQHSDPSFAPFRITFATPSGERMGILVYAFFANCRTTRNRPADECRFQVKYGSKDGQMHELWRDPYGLYTTLFLGIDPEAGIFVGADPVLNSPTLFFISKEYKMGHRDTVLANGWHAWTRQNLDDTTDEPVEVLVGGTPDRLLDYVYYEREVLGEDQGHREMVAEQFLQNRPATLLSTMSGPGDRFSPERVSLLEHELDLPKEEILDLIDRAPRLKMAVRGWVAERHLVQQLRALPGVTECSPIEGDGQPDVSLRYKGSRPILIECKNVLRKKNKDGIVRLDFQRTRVSKADPCSRYYSPTDFDIVAACVHAHTNLWEFEYTLTREMAPHRHCPGKLSASVPLLPTSWRSDPLAILEEAAATAG
jgi:hypothetical protein